MGYFAILCEDPEHLDVRRCHINLWVLDGLFGRRIFYLDVGLGLASRESSRPAGLSLALPAAINAGDFRDLYKETLASARLIFGEPATVNENNLQIGEGADRLSLFVSPMRAKPDTDSSGDDYSVWKIEPVQWQPDREIYVRGRFRLDAFRRGWLPQKSGALIDLRVCDVRESVNADKLEEIDTRIRPIPALNLFAIVPVSLKCKAASPQPRHVRMLEGEAWSGYLRRKKASLSKRKLAVYHWKSDGKPIDRRNPFRAFLDLSEERAVIGWRTYMVFVLLAAFLVCGREAIAHRQSIAGFLEQLWNSTFSALATVGIVGVAATLWTKGKFILASVRKIPAARRAARKLEDWYFT